MACYSIIHTTVSWWARAAQRISARATIECREVRRLPLTYHSRSTSNRLTSIARRQCSIGTSAPLPCCKRTTAVTTSTSTWRQPMACPPPLRHPQAISIVRAVAGPKPRSRARISWARSKTTSRYSGSTWRRRRNSSIEVQRAKSPPTPRFKKLEAVTSWWR